jgi:aminopeptidase N
MWTQGQAEENQYWFPGFDDPSDVATIETRVTVEAPYTVVGNGALVDRTENPDGTLTWTHRLDVPIPTNLVSLAVGEYGVLEDEAEGVPILSYAPVDRMEEAPLAYRDTGRMLSLFAEWNGTPYAYPVYRQVAVGHYLFGGMENAAASTLTDRTLHGPADHGTYRSDELIAHELAHQWWGNRVSVRRWSDEWMSEGFATWFETLWWEHSEGEARAAWHRRDNLSWYLGEAEQYVRPLVTRYYDHEDDLWDGHGYSKGFWVAHMLRRELGDDGFRAFLRVMTAEHARPIETEELRLAAERVSGLALDGFFEQWVYRGGHPELEASWDWDDRTDRVRLRLAQVQETNELVPLFSVPLRVDLTGDDWHRTETVTFDRAEAEFLFEAPERPRMVELDRDFEVLRTLSFDKSLAEWIRQLRESPSAASRWAAAEALGEWEDDRATRALVEALRDEDEFFGVRVLAAEALAERPVPEGRSALLGILGEAPDVVREAAAKALGAWEDGTVVGALAGLTREDPAAQVAGAAAEALGEIGTDEAVDALREALARDSWRETVRAEALRALGRIEDGVEPGDVLGYAAPGHALPVRTAALGAASRLAADLDEEDPARMAVLDRARAALQDPIIQVRSSGARALGRLGGDEAREALRLRARVDEHPSVRRAIRRAEESLERGDEMETLRDRIDELEEENRRLEEALEETGRGG